MVKMRAITLVLGGSLMVAAVPARADVLKLFGEAHLGGMGGKGISGDLKDEAFFANAPHLMYGAKLGARFLIIDAVIQHHQYRGSDELATWTQFSAGVGIQVDLGSEWDRKQHKGGFVEFGALLGFGLGTGRQVDPPLSNDEITDKGAVLEGRLGFGKHLNKVFDVGVAVSTSWSYLLKAGAANDVGNHYQSVQAEGLLYLRANIKLL